MQLTPSITRPMLAYYWMFLKSEWHNSLRWSLFDENIGEELLGSIGHQQDLLSKEAAVGIKCSPKVLNAKVPYSSIIPWLGIPTVIHLPWYRLQLFEKSLQVPTLLTVDISVMHVRCLGHSIFDFPTSWTTRIFIPQDTMMSMDCLRHPLS